MEETYFGQPLSRFEPGDLLKSERNSRPTYLLLNDGRIMAMDPSWSEDDGLYRYQIYAVPHPVFHKVGIMRYPDINIEPGQLEFVTKEKL